jgi:hypothetical protein
MISTYSYIGTSHSKLHEFVMAFFNRIEFETGDFSTDFYVKEFYENVVSHHPGILNKRFKFIHQTIKDWDQKVKSAFIQKIRDSNEIENVCAGRLKPMRDNEIPKDIRQEAKDLFESLYETVLKKAEHYGPSYGYLKDHYITFQKHKDNKQEYCPSCATWQLMAAEEGRDQYDHYLPKENYPFSAVNFKNLVPICSRCNTFEVKSNQDILSFTGVAFYPFDENHKGIDIEIKIRKQDPNDIAKTEWIISYSCPDGKPKELSAWKAIYKIEDRHQKHVCGHVDQWYRHYHEHMDDKDSKLATPNEEQRRNSYLRPIKKRRYLEYITLTEIISSFDTKARAQSKAYSRY